MIQELQLRILPEQAANEQSLKQIVAQETGAKSASVWAVRILKRSIDARQRTIYVNLKVRANMGMGIRKDGDTRSMLAKHIQYFIHRSPFLAPCIEFPV